MGFTSIAPRCLTVLSLLMMAGHAHAQYIPPSLQGAQQGGPRSGQQTAPQGGPQLAQGAQRPQQPAAPIPPPPPDLVQIGLEMAAPMNVEQIRELMQELHRRNTATRENFSNRPPARPVTSLQTLDLSPGSTPPVVRVAVGQGSILSFADAAGRPWEIIDNVNFNATAFDVRLIGPHLYAISLREPSAASISIVLKDLPRPIVVTVVPAQNEVDSLVEFTVPRFLGGRPPANALATAADPSAPVFNAQTLLGFLYRTPPRDAVALRVEGLHGVQAWQSGPNTMVVRTDGLMMLPAWLRRHVASDGMAVFEVPLSPVVAISQNGQVHRGAISGFVVGTATAQQTGQAGQAGQVGVAALASNHTPNNVSSGAPRGAAGGQP